MIAKKYTASLKELHEMLRWIRNEASQIGFLSFQLYQIELASEEAIVNVIHHSYQDQHGEIEISISVDHGRMEIEISDRGKAFNPLVLQHQKNKTDSLDEKKEGGLGLIYIRKCMDEIRYHRKDHRNILTMIKNRTEPK